LFSFEFFTIYSVDVPKKEKKRKEKKKRKYSESECVVCIFVYECFFLGIKLQRIKKNLIF